jgi:YHS domain-containing protein
MLIRWLYWIVIALLLRLVWRSLFRSAWAQSEGGASGVHAGPAIYKGLMVRDPVCGLHVPESRALVEHRAGERVFFCSEACRASYRSPQPERSASDQPSNRSSAT